MYLKSIEVQGFKSFANKLVFEFHNGITGIVGPNGSGKSNVADAVRWVLGEQSAKQLRGAKMEDVIFSGTEMRRPVSYAYVALTISNEDHVLQVPYEEVQVARRLYRSGESEYLLNGVVTTMTTIKELFYDTGIGKEGYSIIGQGQIDKILSNKPEDRRELFDEAAGIVKYKRRKIKAEKNLEAERQNLLRVNDILTELENQIAPLERQSKKAKEFLLLRDELKELDVNMFLLDYDSIQEEIVQTEEKLTITNNDLTKVNQENESMRQNYGEVEEAIANFDASIEEKKNSVQDGKIRLTKLSGQLQLLNEQISSIVNGKEYFGDRMTSISDLIEQTKTKIEQYKQEQKETFSGLEQLEQSAQKKDNEIQQTKNEIEHLENEVSEFQKSIYQHMNEVTDIKTGQQKAESMLEQNKLKKAELTKRILTNKSDVTEATDQMNEEEKKLRQLEQVVEEKNNLKTVCETKAREIRMNRQKNEQMFQEKQREFHMESSRYASLKNMTERYDGYGQSIRKVMEQKENKAGIIGVVADVINVDKKYQTAVETALGGQIQHIITEDEQTAKQAIEYLKKNKFGRATFLPLTTVTAQPGRIKPDVLSSEGVIDTVANLVGRDSKYDGLIEYLLGRFVLVDQINHGLSLAKKFNYSLRIVTLEGDLINPGGSMSGGAYRNSSNLLGRKSEMEQLKAKINQLTKDIERCKEESAQLVTEEDKEQKQIREIINEIQKIQIDENTARIRYEQAVEVKERKEIEYNSILQDAAEIEKQKEILDETLLSIKEKLTNQQTKSDEAKETVEQNAKKIEELRLAEHKLQEDLTKANLDIQAFKQKNQFTLENLNRSEEELKQHETEYAELVEDNEKSDANVKEAELRIEQTKAEEETLRQRIEQLEQEVNTLVAQKEELLVSQKEFFDKRNDVTEKASSLDKEVFRLNARKEKLSEQSENQIAYMWNQYELTYHTALPLKTEMDITYPRMKSRVSEIKSSMKSLGDVNVNAVEEYKNVSSRYELLKTQHDDLIDSEEALMKIIGELEEEMRKQFNEKFEVIRKQFDRVFKELFGGGKGTLRLMDDEDVLEAGVEITAQPPGKNLKNMMQLSGGERALTAIALLFAIQNLKPSPFCLLDEIEAALDDANVKRYAKYLHKLTKNTQFIVITHKQGTMTEADALYGITMQEKGVSTLVSVKLIEDQLDQ